MPVDGEHAVEAFLEYLHLWWPTQLRTAGDDSHLALEGGQLVEEAADGGTHLWAAVSISFQAETTSSTTVTVSTTDATARGDWQLALASFHRFVGGSR